MIRRIALAAILALPLACPAEESLEEFSQRQGREVREHIERMDAERELADMRDRLDALEDNVPCRDAAGFTCYD